MAEKLFDLNKFVADAEGEGIYIRALVANTENGMCNIALFPSDSPVSEFLFGEYHEEIISKYWREV